MLTTATVALLTGSAFAQDPPRTSDMPRAAAPAGKAQVIAQQTADQWLASKFKGTDVIGADNAKIGDVNDILFDKDYKVVAFVVGVGGFLGIGSKDVAIAPASFQIQPATDRENMKLRLAMTKDELKSAAEFKPYKDPAPTTGMNPRDRTNTPAPPPVRQ
jgi:hypothetical protein